MSVAIGSLLAGVLFFIAGAHGYWALGGHWPAKNETALAQTVVGTPDMKRMPGTALTLSVAAAIAGAGALALWLADLFVLPVPDWIRTAAAGCLILVFAVRGGLTYVALCLDHGPLKERVEPFATLDAWIYAPLCLALAAGFLVLVQI